MPGHGEVAQRATRSASGSGTSRRCSTCAGPAGGDRPSARAPARDARRIDAPPRGETSPPSTPAWSGSRIGRRAQRARLRREVGAPRGPAAARRRTGRRAPGSWRAASSPPAFTARRTAREADGVGQRRVDALAGPPAGGVGRDVEQLPEAPGVDGDAALRRLVGQVGRQDDRAGRGRGRRCASGRWRARFPASTTTRIASGAACEEAGPERVVARGRVVQGARPGQVHQPRLAAAGGDPAPLEAHGGAGRVGGLDEAAAGAGEEGGLADVGPADQGDDRPAVGRRRATGTRGRGVAGRVGHQPGSSGAAEGPGRHLGGDGGREREARPAELHDDAGRRAACGP